MCTGGGSDVDNANFTAVGMLQDGLDIYYALREYFTEYLGLYYSDTGAAGKPKVLRFVNPGCEQQFRALLAP